MSLQEKLEYKAKNWSFINNTGPWTKELLLSNDGKYIFHCKFQLGKFEADSSNLNRRE